MSLTLKGFQFLRHAEKILAEVSNARRALNENGAPAEGRLQLGVTPLVAGYILADLLARFRRASPLLDVAVVEDLRDYLEHLLIGGELDIAVMVLPPRAALLSLETELVEVSRYRLWLPLGHPLAQASVVSLGDLASEPQIMLAIDEIDEAPKSVWQQLGVRPPVAFRTRPWRPCGASSPRARESPYFWTSPIAIGRSKATRSRRAASRRSCRRSR